MTPSRPARPEPRRASLPRASRQRLRLYPGKNHRSLTASLRYLHERIDESALLRDLRTRLSFQLSKILLHLKHVGLPLRIEVSNNILQTERKLALLSRFALIEHVAHTSHQLIG